MIRICIFGTSHLAALHQAHMIDRRRWPDADLTFIGATGRKLLSNRIDQGVMTPQTNVLRKSFKAFGGVHEIRLEDYDAFVVAGAQVGLHMIGFLYNDMRWLGMPSVGHTAQFDHVRWQLVSKAAVEAHIDARLAEVVGGVFVRQLRAATNRPIVVTSCPRVSARLLRSDRQTNRHKLKIFRKLWRNGDAETASQTYDKIAADHFAKTQVTYLPQPERTIARHCMTHPKYMNGAMTMTAAANMPQPDHDLTHANAKYGALVLDQVMETVAAAS